jgi:hypothetical protein
VEVQGECEACTKEVQSLNDSCTSPVLLWGVTSSFLVDNFEKIVDPTTHHFYDFGQTWYCPCTSLMLLCQRKYEHSTHSSSLAFSPVRINTLLTSNLERQLIVSTSERITFKSISSFYFYKTNNYTRISTLLIINRQGWIVTLV